AKVTTNATAGAHSDALVMSSSPASSSSARTTERLTEPKSMIMMQSMITTSGTSKWRASRLEISTTKPKIDCVYVRHIVDAQWRTKQEASCVKPWLATA